MPHIGNYELHRKKPSIVAIIDEMIAPENLLYLKDKADLLEMRIDCYKKTINEMTDYLRNIRNTLAMPMIGTVRENDFTKNDRPGIFRAITPLVDCIDIELGTPIADEVRLIAQGKTLIVSEHDFDTTPDDASLSSIIDRSLHQGADIVKISVMAHKREDVTRLLSFTAACSDPLVAISMGEYGTISRVIAPLFGSLFSYGYITRPVAPGQLSVATLFREFRNYYPEYRS